MIRWRHKQNRLGYIQKPPIDWWEVDWLEVVGFVLGWAIIILGFIVPWFVGMVTLVRWAL